MLVLTRKQSEQIIIGGEITVTIVRLKGNVVQIGIEAPDNVRVLRGEIPPFDGERQATTGHQATTTEAGRTASPVPQLRGAAESLRHEPGRSTGLRPVMEQSGRYRGIEPALGTRRQRVTAK